MTRTLTRGATTALGAALAAAGIVAAVLALLLLPPWLVDQAGASLEGADLTKAVTEERRTVLAVLAAIGAAVTLWYTHQRQELDRDANRTDRYTKAVEQLGDDTKPSVQLGGVYALERVAIDSRRDRAVSIEVLAAFVRQQSTRAVDTDAAASTEGANAQDPTPERAGTYQPSEPVLAALSVIARRPRGDDTYPAPNLADVDLTGVDLTGASLHGANLRGADLTDANLSGADLTGADLIGAILTVADLTEADLTGANLTEAELTGANLHGANLTRANLHGANLTHTVLFRANLTHAVLRRANLSNALLTDANLNHAVLLRADLTGALLTDADLTGVRYDNSTTWPGGFTPPASRGD